jgi:predicted NBD/HSP70 family sugar kinase
MRAVASARDVFAAADRGDARAAKVVAEEAVLVAKAICAVVAVADPELIVIGGGFGIAAFDFLLPRAREVLARDALDDAGERTSVVRAELGTAAGVIGAALVALDAVG